MKVSRRFLILGLCAAAFYAIPARAVDQFVPTSAWLVGPATIIPADGGKAAKMPCVMATQYNNGFMLRFSAGGSKIYAMAVDFRQDAFEKEAQYDAVLKIDSSFEQKIPTLALNKGTLLINLQKQDGLYNALLAGKVMTLTIAGTPFEFALLGVRDGLNRIEGCFGGSADAQDPGKEAFAGGTRQDGIPPAYSEAMGQEVPSSQPPALPAGMHEVADQPTLDDMRRVQAISEQKAPPQPGTSSKPDLATAELEKKMAQLDSMIAGAAQKLAALETAAGTEGPVPQTQTIAQAVAPSMASAPVVPQPQRPVMPAAQPIEAPAQLQVQPSPQPMVSPLQEAQPIGRPLANTWMSPYMAQAQNSGLRQRDILVANTVAQQQNAFPPAGERRWRAMRGSNLHEIMDVWARYENARLIWQADEDLAIEDSISMKGTFEQAVQTVLEQFADKSHRPTGRIYIDPGLNQKVLLVETGSKF